MKPTIRTSRGPVVILVALLAGLLIAACGGSSNSGGSSSKNASKTTTTGTTPTGKAATATRTALAACLKKSGVTFGAGAGARGFGHGTSTTGAGGFAGGGTPPSGAGTPSAGGGSGTPPSGAAGGGFPGGGAGGFAGRNSKFAKAITACDKKLGIKPGTGFGGAGRFRGGGAGGSGFTPHFSTATLKSYVACIRKNGYAAMPEPKASKTGSFFPKSVESNAQFKAANKKCESVLLKAFRSFRPGAAGGAGAGGTSTISGSSTVSGG